MLPLSTSHLEELANVAVIVTAVATVDGDPSEIWKDVSESEEAAIQTVLNSYEEIANEYNAGFLDQKAAEPLVFLATIAWQQGHELIEWLRQGDPRYLDQWETLYLNAPPDLRPEPA